jgi:hypothetical protein
MGIEVREFKDGTYLIWDRYNCEAVNWESLFIDEDEIRKYLTSKPFPDDKKYTKEDLLMDLNATGSITLRCEKGKTAEYIAEMIYSLI